MNMRSFIVLFLIGLLCSCSPKKPESEEDKIKNICESQIFGPCINPISDFKYGATQLILTKNQAVFFIVPTYNASADLEFYSDITLPVGIELDRDSGTIMGSPVDIQEERTYTIVAKYKDAYIREQFIMRGMIYLEAFDISIKVKDIPPDNLSYNLSEVIVERGGLFPITTVQTNLLTGGPVTSYEISPELPVGIYFNSSTGEIYGSPFVEQLPQEYIITAKNSGGQVSTSILITIEGVSPKSLTYLDSSISYLAGKKIPRDNLPLYSGDTATSYSISPELPRGLIFNTETGHITGNPEEVRESNLYTVTASNDWGSTSFDIDISTLNNITGISTGLNHSCVIKNKKVSCSGRNEFFQLGRDTVDTCTDASEQSFNCSRTFDFVEYNSLPLESLSIVSTRNNTCSLGEDTNVKCWGDNSIGQLGTGNLSGFNKHPENVVDVNNNEITSIEKIDSGTLHICAKNSQGNLLCWGDNTFGQLGELVLTQRNKADYIRDSQGNPLVVDDFAVGYNSTCYVKNQEVKCLGSNEFFNLGDGTNNNRNQFVSVLDILDNILMGVKKVVLGRSFSLSIKNNDDIFSWGNNEFGQLGTGDTTSHSKAKETDVDGLPIKSNKVYKGENSFCYIENGLGYCLGQNNFDFGYDTVTNVNPNPVPILEDEAIPMEDITDISNGYSLHRCLAKTGELFCFGNNLGGQLGDGTISQKLLPKNVIVPE